MSETATGPLRVLFCIGINQNFFDLPTGQGAVVWQGFSTMMADLAALPGVTVLGSMDDDQHMVGPAQSWPWTCYILADVDSQATVAAACNLFRSTPVGEYSLWRYAHVEARIGRPLTMPASVAGQAG
ncbi:hypothetical protein CFN78_14795 [Amycolatopsis antarctica]|uniref:IacB n=1 Tax=Amycolatopsis antarctica TaxID=1854586 RepID=A0A263D1F3_9PSEU|nr:hypothetical protein [Amycolatopsis antarctica]OZM72283.1 hypothetical protein CFN78_14795 [Amycolatopsis antarctica]